MNGRNEAYFDKHRDWIKKKLGEEHPIYKILASDEAWVRMIAECSNAVRHEEKGLKVEVENFSLKPGNKIASPGWRYDLTKKGLERQEHCSDLIHDLEVLMNNMLAFYEDILLVCIQNKLKNDNGNFEIFRIPNEKINPKCPILYEVNWTGPARAVALPGEIGRTGSLGHSP